MELKRTAIFLGIVALIGLGLSLLLGPVLSWSVAERPATAKRICAENKRLSEADSTKDRVKRMSQTECRGAADARNGKPEQATTVEYREGYLYGLKLKRFRDGQSYTDMNECVEEWEVTEKAYREKHGIESQ